MSPCIRADSALASPSPFGCAAAEDIGVIPDPEVSATQLGPQHAFVVLATDGVWEFISSQKAVEIVSGVGWLAGR